MDSNELIQRTGAKRQPDGSYRTHCPVCQTGDTKNPSLSIRDDGGVMLVHCHKSDCDFVDILRAVGGETTSKTRSKTSAVVMDVGTSQPEKRRRTHSPASGGDSARVVATYQYTDENGEVLYCKDRYQPKNFRQYRLVDGAKVNGLGDVRRVPYNLPAVMRAERVYIVEGEKDVDRMQRAGLVATSSSDWHDDFAQYFAGKDVVVIPDNDEPGDKKARRVKDALADVDARVWIVDLPDVGPKGDVSDFLQTHTQRELVELVEDVMRQPANLPAYTPTGLSSAQFFHELANERDGLKTGFSSLDEVFEIPRGGTTLVSANTGVGKTTFKINLAYNMLTASPDARVAFFSYEERGSHIAAKFVVRDAEFVMHETKNIGYVRKYIANHAAGNVASPKPTIDAAIGRVSGWLDSGRLLINDVEPDAEMLVKHIEALAVMGVDCVFVDYAQQLRDNSHKGDNRRLELAKISSGLKNVAKVNDISVVLGSQLTDDKIRDARDLEFDALAVLRLEREIADNLENPDVKITVKKNRNGRAGTVLYFAYDGRIVKVADKTAWPRPAATADGAQDNILAVLPDKRSR